MADEPHASFSRRYVSISNRTGFQVSFSFVVSIKLSLSRRYAASVDLPEFDETFSREIRRRRNAQLGRTSLDLRLVSREHREIGNPLLVIEILKLLSLLPIISDVIGKITKRVFAIYLRANSSRQSSKRIPIMYIKRNM